MIPYRPRSVWRGFHDSEARWRVAVAHRRAGKTVAFVNEAIRAALKCERPAPRFGYLAPQLGQAKAIAWDYVRRYCAPIPGVRFNESELRADLPNGGRVRLFGADNINALRGLYGQLPLNLFNGQTTTGNRSGTETTSGLGNALDVGGRFASALGLQPFSNFKIPFKS